MSELVNRLRGLYPVGPDGVYGTRDFSSFIPPICKEAADEIERLNATVDEQRQRIEALISGCEDRGIEGSTPVLTYIGRLESDLEENEEVLKAVEAALDDVPYKGSYADGIKFLTARIKELEDKLESYQSSDDAFEETSDD